jgi:quinol monooxygenase YgiN
MYALISQIRAHAGQREALVALLLGRLGELGCRIYVVACDAAEADAFWVTEVWDSQSSHNASLTSR